MLPVLLRQHGLDENPEFTEFLKAQTSRTQLISEIGHRSSVFLHQDAKQRSRRVIEQREIDNERLRNQLLAEKRRSEEVYAAAKAEKAEKKRLKREKVERLWKIMMKKVTLEPPNEDYYEKSPLQPGIGFFRQLLGNQKHSANGLPLRIPEMLLVAGSILWVKNQETQLGSVLSITNEFRMGEFHQAFPRERTFKRPVAILRVPHERPQDTKAMPLTFEEFSSTLNASKLPSTGLVQRYVHCHADKLAVTRLFYYAQSDANISPHAFALTASKAALKYPYGEWILLSEQPGAVDVFPISGIALNRVVKDAQTIVTFLQNSYGVRIQCIVLDFLRDAKDCFWLLSCKGILVDQAAVMLKDVYEQQKEVMSAGEIAAFTRDKLNEQQSAMHCKLCLMPYKPTEMTHVLPFKMLLLFKLHTANRGHLPFDLSHLRVNTMDFLSHWVRLCEICYLLVLNECELMETELKLAEVLNIPTKLPDVMNEPVIIQPNFMPHRVHQWRVLLYFRDFEFRSHHPHSKGVLYLQYTFFGSRFCYQLKPISIHKEPIYRLTRLYYFFATENTEVRRFARTCESDFRLTSSPDWEHCIAKGTCHPLSNFTCDMQDNDAICQPFEVLLFDGDELVVRVMVIVGLAKDREVNVRKMPISIARLQGLYVPEASYINSEPLPAVWIEAFSGKYQGLERTELLDSSGEIEQMYSPQLIRKEIYAQPLSSTHVLHTDVDLDPFPRPPRPTLNAQLKPKLELAGLPMPWKSVKSRPVTGKSGRPSSGRRPSLSTSTSSKVIYQSDSHLRSPAFVSPRFTLTSPHPVPPFLTSDSSEALFTDQETTMSERQLKDTIATFLKKRDREELKPWETARFTERSTKPSLPTERKLKKRHRRARSSEGKGRKKTQAIIAAYTGVSKFHASDSSF